MSKIGRIPINISSVKIDLKGNVVNCTAPNGSFVHTLPAELSATVSDDNKELFLVALDVQDKDSKRLWGLHRALLSNEIIGITTGFEKKIEIVGLGYKAIVSGNKVQFSLGFSHKIDFELPSGVDLETDKSGQKLTLKARDKALLGLVASTIKALRPPEPYKGTGIRYAGEEVRRKVGKAKS